VSFPSPAHNARKTEEFMTRTARILLSLVAALALLSAMTFAETKAKADTKQGHPSKLSKVAFWKHHKSNAAKPDSAKSSENTKAAKVTPAKTSEKNKTVKVTPAKATDSKAKTPSAKGTEKKAKLIPAKATSTKQPVSKKENAPKQKHASVGKSAVAPAAAKKPKTQAKATQPDTNHQASQSTKQ
jgi:hypothetical protein